MSEAFRGRTEAEAVRSAKRRRATLDSSPTTVDVGSGAMRVDASSLRQAEDRPGGNPMTSGVLDPDSIEAVHQGRIEAVRQHQIAADGQKHSAADCQQRPAEARLQRLAAEVEQLGGLDLDDLRLRYRLLTRKAAPSHLPRWLLLRIVAYRLQADVLGDLDRETLRYLDKIAKDQDGIAKEQSGGANAPREAGSSRNGPGGPRTPMTGGVPPVPSRLRPGTQLVREHGGELHRVIVLDAGFSWNGRTFTSLSEVARAITGTTWNGPAFFGLRPSKRVKGNAVIETASIAGGSL